MFEICTGAGGVGFRVCSVRQCLHVDGAASRYIVGADATTAAARVHLLFNTGDDRRHQGVGGGGGARGEEEVTATGQTLQAAGVRQADPTERTPGGSDPASVLKSVEIFATTTSLIGKI